MASFNILNISHNYFVQGGSDQYFLALEELLRGNGHNVIPFCAASHRNKPTEYAKYFPSSPSFSSGRFIDVPRFLYSGEARRNMQALLAAEPADIAHLHIYYGKLTPSILRPLKEAGIPIVQTVHEYKLICPVYTLTSNGKTCQKCSSGHYWPAIRNRCNRGSFARSSLSAAESYLSHLLGDAHLVDRFIAVSDFVRDRLVQRGIDPKKIEVISNFVDSKFNATEELPGDYIIYSGRIEAIKGVFTLLDALTQLPNVKCIFVGTGSDQGRLESEISARGLSNVEVRGFVSRQEVRALVSGSRGCVVPSQWFEPFGLVAIEAMACGRPVIASRIGGLTEIVDDHENGILVEPGNVDELARAIQSLIGKPDNAAVMGSNASKKAGEKFSEQAHYRQIESLYSRLIPGAQIRKVHFKAPTRKPAILNVSHNYHVKGGSDRYFMELEQLLKRQGHRVIPFCAKDARNEDSEYARYFPESFDSTKLSSVDAFRYLFSRAARHQIRSLLTEQALKIAHLHIYYGKLTSSILRPLREYGIPIVQTLHEYKLLCPVYNCVSNGQICEKCHGKDFYKAFLNKCNDGSRIKSAASATESYVSRALGSFTDIDHFIAPSEFLAQRMRDIGVSADRITTVYNFVTVAEEAPEYCNSDYVLYFGRIDRTKGIFTLLEAMRRTPSVRCVIVGGGPSKQEFLNELEKKPADNIQYLPFCSGDELDRLVERSICTIIPSEWHENCSMSALESMALARPVIATRIGGNVELVEDGENGLLVTPGSPEELADAVQRVAGSTHLAKKMGNAAWEIAREKFSPDTHYRKLVAVYDSVLG